MTADGTPGERIAWVDYAKGLCIVMVVMMHSTLGVGQAAGGEGWLHLAVAYAQPFRMPDFFLISGLFLAQVIDRDWRTYLDRKVLHFFYFYLLWTAIQFALKAPGLAQGQGVAGLAFLYLETFWEPFGTLWFIYLLPVFFVLTKLAHGLRVPAIVVWLAAAALEIAPIHTGFTVIDEFASRFVYFYTGYILAPRIFMLAQQSQRLPEAALAGLTSWALLNGVLVFNGVRRTAVCLARAGAGRRRSRGRSLGAAGTEPRVRAASLLRRAFDRHLSRLLPRHGGKPVRTAQIRFHRRYRHHLGDCDARRHHRRAGAVLGGPPHAAADPVRAAGAVLDRAAQATNAPPGGVTHCR